MSNHAAMLQINDHDGLIEARLMMDAIVDEANIQSMDRELKSIIDGREQPMVVINFGNVRHLSSSALGTLISFNSAVQDRDGQLRLAEINDTILEVFKITKLDRIFVIEETAQDARASLR